MLTATAATRTFIIPGWVYRAIIRHHRLQLIDLTDYAKIRPILSQDDMVTWTYLNNQYKLSKTPLTYQLLGDLFGSSLDVDYQRIIQPLSLMDHIGSIISERLADTNSMTNTKPYQLISVNDLLLIILNEGFEAHIQESPDNLMSFLKAYLKGLYQTSTIANASSNPLYRLYLELL